MGCQDVRAGRRLIDSPPLSLDETVRLVKTYQLSHRALAPRRRGVHAARYSDRSSVEETSRTRSPVLRDTDIEMRHKGALSSLIGGSR